MKVVNDIRDGTRPSRPSRNRWLQDPVWDVITTGWSHEPEERCKLSFMHDTFVMSSQRVADSGDTNNQNDGNLTIAD